MNTPFDRTLAWHKINVAVEGRTHTHIWRAVKEKLDAHIFWVRVMDRVVGRAWRPFSPEVSGNRL